MADYVRTAADALALCCGKDPYLPEPSEIVLRAWAEDLEYYAISYDDALEAVRLMYRAHGNPGFRPTSKLLCDTARKIRQDRAARMPSLEAADDRITLAEWQRRHGPFPSFTIGKAVPDEEN